MSKEKEATSVPDSKSAYSKSIYTDQPEFYKALCYFSSAAVSGLISGTESEQEQLSGRLLRNHREILIIYPVKRKYEPGYANGTAP